MKIPGLITVRTSSSRLPKKCLLPFGAGSVIEHVIERANHYGLEPIICTSTDATDETLAQIADKKGIRFFRGSLNNKLLRWKECCDQLDLTAFHTIDADDLFFCGETMKRSFDKLSPETPVIYPSEYSAAGGGTTGYSMLSSFLKSVCAQIPEDADTEMVEAFIPNSHPRLMIEEIIPEKTLARFTLDYHEDYIFLEAIRLLLGNNCSRAEINELLIRNQDLLKINWFRNQEWKERQIEKINRRI